MSSDRGSETAGESAPRTAEQELVETRPIRDNDRGAAKTDDEQWSRIDLNQHPDADKYLAEDEPWTPEEQAALDAGRARRGEIQEAPESPAPAGGLETDESQLDSMQQAPAPTETGQTLRQETPQTAETGIEPLRQAERPEKAEAQTDDRDKRGQTTGELQAPTDDPTETGETRETGETAVATTEALPPGYGTMPVRLDNGERLPGPGDFTRCNWNQTAETWHPEPASQDAYAPPEAAETGYEPTSWEPPGESRQYTSPDDVHEGLLEGKSVSQVYREIAEQPPEPKPEPTTETVRSVDGLSYEKGMPSELPKSKEELTEPSPEDLSRLDQARRVGWKNASDIKDGLGKGSDRLVDLIGTVKPTGTEVRHPPPDHPSAKSPNSGVDAGDAATSVALLAALVAEAVRMRVRRAEHRREGK